MDKNKTHNLRKAIMLAERMGLKKTTTIFEGLEEKKGEKGDVSRL